MSFRSSPALASPALAVAFAAAFVRPAVANAQTTTTATGPSVQQPTGQTAPYRYLNYGQSNQESLGTATRPAGLNPTGVNYSDCISDMTLVFPVILSGFGVGNSDGMQIWASVYGTCTFDTARGNPGPPTCWLVDDAVPLGSTDANGSQNFPVRVQDLVGPQQSPPASPTLVHEGPSACNAQPSYAAVDIFLWFVPISGEGTFDQNSSALKWQVTTDLVGPPAPVGVTVGAGQDLLTVNWMANADSDTFGYDVFIDPPAGSVPEAGMTTEVNCPSSGSSSSGGAGSSDAQNASDDASDDANDGASSSSSASSGSESSSGNDASGSEAGCETVNVAQTAPGQGGCISTVLGGALLQDGGSEAVGDASAGDEDDGAVEGIDEAGAGVGGIATIPCQYALGAGCPSGSPVYTGQSMTVTGETNTSKNITGLVDGVTYAVVVSAVDSSGNPGPPSAQSASTCNYPAPVNDFFSVYREAGGLAGGGYCAIRGGTELEASSGSPIGASIALTGACAAALAAERRRRRRKGAAAADE